MLPLSVCSTNISLKGKVITPHRLIQSLLKPPSSFLNNKLPHEKLIRIGMISGTDHSTCVSETLFLDHSKIKCYAKVP